jgi:predicted RNA-binding Zn-ribbon protein involved in translation (DUF1610 family)
LEAGIVVAGSGKVHFAGAVEVTVLALRGRSCIWKERMGRTYHFECPQCQYRAKVSGGADSGIHCEVQTVLCQDCRELLDVYTRLRRDDLSVGRPPKFPGFSRPEVPPVILADGTGKRRLVWEKFKLSCPVNPKHQVELWNEPGRCPRCGNYMEKNGIPFKVWE